MTQILKNLHPYSHKIFSYFLNFPLIFSTFHLFSPSLNTHTYIRMCSSLILKIIFPFCLDVVHFHHLQLVFHFLLRYIESIFIFIPSHFFPTIVCDWKIFSSTSVFYRNTQTDGCLYDCNWKCASSYSFL